MFSNHISIITRAFKGVLGLEQKMLSLAVNEMYVPVCVVAHTYVLYNTNYKEDQTKQPIIVCVRVRVRERVRVRVRVRACVHGLSRFYYVVRSHDTGQDESEQFTLVIAIVLVS